MHAMMHTLKMCYQIVSVMSFAVFPVLSTRE